MAILDDILSALGGAADSSGLSGVLQDIGTAARDSAREERRSLDFIESLPPIARSILQNEAMSMGYSNVEEAMMFQPGIMNARATELAKYYLTPAEEPQPPMRSDEILRTELPSPVPRPKPPVPGSPLPPLNTEDILTLQEIGSIRRGVESDIANQRQRYEEEQARANMSPAKYVESQVLQRPRLGGVGKSPVEETVTNLAVGMGLDIGQNDNLNTLINMIGAEDPQLANYITEGVKEGAIGTASSILSVVSAPVLASLATRFLSIRPEVAMQMARDPVRGKLLRDELGRFISRQSVGPQTRQQQFGSAGAAARQGSRASATAQPSPSSSAQKTMEAAKKFRSGFPGTGIYNAGGPIRRMGGGTMRDKILNNYNRMV